MAQRQTRNLKGMFNPLKKYKMQWPVSFADMDTDFLTLVESLTTQMHSYMDEFYEKQSDETQTMSIVSVSEMQVTHIYEPVEKIHYRVLQVMLTIQVERKEREIVSPRGEAEYAVLA